MLTTRRGFTMIEAAIAVAVSGVIGSIITVQMAATRDDALVKQSLAHLRTLAAACAAYSNDHNDRQYTAVPDETGMYGDGCIDACAKLTVTQCLPQMILGWDSAGGLWGYWCRGTPARCEGWPGSCDGNFAVYQACDYWGECKARWVGSWRLTNCKAFNSYVNGRYYDKVFWAPKDRVSLEAIGNGFGEEAEFSGGVAKLVLPTYCSSPSAMWSPEVLDWKRRIGQGMAATIGAAPRRDTMPGAYKSPAVGVASYPSLKWRMWEHQWLQGLEGAPLNPAFDEPTPWIYNQGANSAPAVMCFDGHTETMPLESIREGQAQAGAQATPLYFNGGDASQSYFADIARDEAAKGAGACNAGILTVGGILGRDALRIGDARETQSPAPPRGTVKGPDAYYRRGARSIRTDEAPPRK